MQLEYVLIIGVIGIAIALPIVRALPQSRTTAKIQSCTPYTALSPSDFAVQYATGTYIVIDVRTPREYAAGTPFSNALLLDLYDPDFRTQLTKLATDTPYLIYCRSGNRSGQAAAMMHTLGFKNVYELARGLNAWETSGITLDT